LSTVPAPLPRVIRTALTLGHGVRGGQPARKASSIDCILSIDSDFRPAPNSAKKPPFP
jgi:hypothetical protein